MIRANRTIRPSNAFRSDQFIMLIGITGATGLLGRALIMAIDTRGWKCRVLDRTAFLALPIIEVADSLDGIDIVVHAAANTDVEHCEIAPDISYRDNLTVNSTRLGLIAYAALWKNMAHGSGWTLRVRCAPEFMATV